MAVSERPGEKVGRGGTDDSPVAAQRLQRKARRGTVHLTRDTSVGAVGAEGITLVDWWADWCGPCKQFGPVFEAASEQHADVVFAKIDTDAEQELASAAQISSIPTLMAFRDGILVFSQPGALPATGLEQVITAVQQLDMEDVRLQVAAAEAAEPQANEA